MKRPSLELHYFECFNQDNVGLVDLRRTPITEVTVDGVITGGEKHELDILVLATGFDAVTGGLTGIDIRGTDGATPATKWSTGVGAYLGVTTAGFPNMLFVYAPQSPSAFCNGPTCGELQGEAIVELLDYLRNNDLTRIESSLATDEAWRNDCIESAPPTLFPMADSWYMGANVPGKPREMLMYPAGVPSYLQQWADAAADGYRGFQLA